MTLQKRERKRETQDKSLSNISVNFIMKNDIIEYNYYNCHYFSIQDFVIFISTNFLINSCMIMICSDVYVIVKFEITVITS